ncbi:M48 family metalloprotease [Streptomyces bambusae]|uniref:M48 family metalloprotease n=1 Tax=Streptomyces bambusae TaxID=1550616 RepID=A0ABS6Z5G5_9ACTN|nr:M48 family metallopeptidase [Streptomyces bambusae]MBW5481971.1 M48 family metalloprotease [Streptomyces bambusae]
MGATLRAVRALVLLAGFYLLGLLLLAALAGIDLALIGLTDGGPVAAKIVVVSVLLAVPIVRGMFMLRTPKDEPHPGIRVTPEQEPRLWQIVRELAEQVDTRAPDEIVLTDEVNASVSEQARFGGLVGGRRTLTLGLPLMSGLDEMQLRAVLAHELGHYSHSDTRFTPLIVRGKAQIERTVAHFHARADKTAAKELARQEKAAAKRLAKGKKAGEVSASGAGATYRAMAKIYTWYAGLFLRATLSGFRRQEYAADLAAARIAGRDAYASALRELPALSAAYGFYMESYATLGLGARLLPPQGQFYGGFVHLLPARSADLDELRTDLPTDPASPYDSHPPIADRVARIEALPDDGRGSGYADGTRPGPALDLLSAPADALAALEREFLSEEALALPRADWDELVHRSMTQYVGQGAGPIREAVAAEVAATTGSSAHMTPGTGTLVHLLDLVEADPAALWRLAGRFPKSDEAAAASGRAAREFARPVVRRALKQLVVVELTAAGTARWQLSWSDEASLRYPGDGYEDQLALAIDAAVADLPDTTPLRKLVLAS